MNFCLDQQGFAGTLLKFYFYFTGDFSKALYTINREIPIANFTCVWLSTGTLEVLLSNLQDRWQRFKINTTFTSWTRLLQGVPQGSVFGPILFVIYINDIYFALKETDTCKFADSITLYIYNSNLKSALETLEKNSELAIGWFGMNCIKLNTDKCHLLLSGYKSGQMWEKLDRDLVWESNHVALLEITLNNKLKLINMCLIFVQKLTENEAP